MQTLLVTHRSLHFENMSIDDSYIRFNQNLDEKSYLNAKIEAVDHFHPLFLLKAEQCK